MSFNIKQFLSVLFCCLPSLCFGIGLDTKIAWEPWAVNGAVMMFCMPDLDETKHLRSGGNGMLGDYKYNLGTVGVISELVVDNETAIITKENVKLMPKCAAFIDSYIAKTEKNNKISLNEIISMCLETIEDKLICENIVLSLVNLTEDKKVLKNYDPKQMEQKIKDSIKADRTICSKDNKFCTTYSLFSERKAWSSLDGVEGDAIYEKENNKIIGMCAGFNYKDVAILPFTRSYGRCLTTDPAYSLYEFGIKDLTDNSIELIYTDWGEMTDVSKKYLERVKPLIQKLDNCITQKNVDADTSWALDTMYKQGTIGLSFVMCERHNEQPNQEDKVVVCKAEILKNLYKDSQKCLQDISFDAAERNLGKYKSMLEDCFMSVRTFQYQALTLLSECEN